MKKLVGFILVAILIAGLAVVVVAVPIGGRTVLERICGSPEQPARPADKPAPPAAATDQLTEKDREGLNQLIENKLEPKAKEGGEDPHPPGK